jgi:hypothetical protein
LSFVLDRQVDQSAETLIAEPISMGFGLARFSVLGICPAEQRRKLATQVRLPSEPRILAKPEGDSVPSVLTARHIEVRSRPLSLASSVMIGRRRQGITATGVGGGQQHSELGEV